MNSIKNLIIYPWLSIWLEPRKTLRHCLASNNIFVLTILLLLTVYMNSVDLAHYSLVESYGYMVQIIFSFLITLVYILLIYFLVRIFNGTILKKEAFLIVVLGNIPYLLYSIYWFFDTTSDIAVIIDGLFALLSIIWHINIMVHMLNEVGDISKGKATFIIFLGLIMELMISMYPVYMAYISNPFIE